MVSFFCLYHAAERKERTKERPFKALRLIPYLTLHSEGKMQALFEAMVKLVAGSGVLLRAF